MHNYDIGKFAMILHSGTNGLQFGVAYPIIITSDDPDQDRGVIDDYRDTLTIGLQSYYQALSNWSRAYLGTEFSGQTGYNLPVDAVCYNTLH